MLSRTLYQVLQDTVAAHGDKPALMQPIPAEKSTKEKKSKSWTWKQHREAVEEIGLGLDSLGIRKGDIVAICSETRAEFYLMDLGIVAIGAVAAALYQSYPANDLLKTITASGAKVLVVEDPKFFELLRGAPVERFILLTGDADGAISLPALQARGRALKAANPTKFEELSSAVTPQDHAILYLTSGATGEPKMVMTTHGGIVSNIEMGVQVIPMTPDDVTIAFLPSAHITQRVVVEFLPMLFGTPVYFSESLLKLPGELKSVRPTMFVAPPRMWERVYASVCTEIRKKPAVIRKIFYGAVALGLAAAKYRREGKRVPARISIPLKLADKAMFQTIRDRFGGRLRIPASGGAPLGKDLADFYESIGMPLIEGYGLTEGGVVAFNPIWRPKSGSIGKLLPDTEVKFAEDGEILVKSPCLFSHYYKDPLATSQVLRDGWLHTGDIGHMDSDGYVFITSRKKELIVSSTGKKVFPARVENLFKFEPLISQVVLVGDRLPFLTALFTIHTPVAETLTGMDSHKGAAAEQISASEPVAKEVQKIVTNVNKQLADFEKIRKFRILPRDFTIETGELTATMKVRKQKVLENFRVEIDSLYAEKTVQGL
jgi:long-chain acyl-CoA synthetase